MEGKQQIEGAGILSRIAQLFFKGLDKAISDAAEYEEEMGVLKQVNHITITDNKTNKDYILTIKLAPVKNKDSVYYVEVETNAPNIDVSKFNNTVQKLNNENIDKYREMIQALLSSSGYETEDIPNDDVTEPEEESEEPEEGEASDKIDLLVQEIVDELSHKGVIATTSDGVLVSINPSDFYTAEGEDGSVNCYFTLSAEDATSGKEVKSIKPKEVHTPAVDDQGNVLSVSTVYSAITRLIDTFIEDNGMSGKQYINTGTQVQATLIKEKDSDEVSITAIKASCDIRAAMNIVCDIVEDDDFVDSLTDDTEQSFSIVDDGESWEIEPVESIDTSDSYCDLFREICIAKSTLDTYEWATGPENWRADTYLCTCKYSLQTLLEHCAVWVINHTDKFPSVIGAFGNDCTELDDLKEDGKISIQKIHNSAKTLLEGLIEILDIYYVNLDHEEQKAVDDFINDVNCLLAYA